MLLYLPYLILYALQQLAIYFFVPLGLGSLLLLSLVRKGGSTQAKALCSILMAVGCAGAFYGVPYWHEKAVEERSASARFDLLCRQRAVTQLPANPVAAEGVLWEASNATRESYFSRGDDLRDLLDPRKGRYVAIEWRRNDGTGFTTRRWDPQTSRPGRLQTTDRDSQNATLPFVVRTERLQTLEDARQGIDGIETTITESSTHRVIAKRVVFGRHTPSAKGFYRYTSVCPTDALRHADCGDNGCSIMNFVLAAVPPISPSDTASAFHLYRGSGRQRVECSFVVSIGPTIGPDDVEWWFQGSEFHLRLRGTSDEMYCEGLFSNSNNQHPEIWFTEQRVHVAARLVHSSRVRGTAERPVSLGQTLAEDRRMSR